MVALTVKVIRVLAVGVSVLIEVDEEVLGLTHLLSLVCNGKLSCHL